LAAVEGFEWWGIILGALLLAGLLRLFFHRVISVLTRGTSTTRDDRLVEAVRGPVVLSIVVLGVIWTLPQAPLGDRVQFLVQAILWSLLVVMWAVALMRAGHLVLEVVSDQVDRIRWIEPKTLPLFDMMLKVVVVGGLLYALCIVWGIPLTSWLTSAGIVGIAVGFAAKDTLSNLFSGVFIVADAPYKVGDYVVLDQTIRGQVLEIGMRSTRLLTRDDIEVTVPNAVIANAQIVNETGGPHEKMRVRVKVEAAYGSDVDQVEEVLLSCVEGVRFVCDQPSPRVRFREFGGSGLVFELLAWIDEPVYRGRVLHELNGKVYKAFNAAGIEIPYSKHDVYIKEALPGTSSS
jgi:small-conductance mechanosensitive channel